VIDRFSGTVDELGPDRPPAIRSLEEHVRAAWQLARIEEIRVVPERTLYDPGIHEASGALARPGLPDGTVLRVERPGFYCDSKVFRRALVTLSSVDAARVGV
jgi:molecular chaperone GrpE (heat shock protein)